MIAIVYPQFYGVGGIARYLDAFLSNLPADHPKIYLITSDENKFERYYPGVELIHLPYKKSRWSMLLWTVRVRRLIKQLYVRNKIKIVNLHIPPFIPWFGLPNYVPYVLTAHTTYLGMSGKFYPEKLFEPQWNWVETNLKMLLEKQIFKSARGIIVLTEQGLQELYRYRIKTPAHIIPNGVDPEVFKPAEHNEERIDVLFCGRIERRKGSESMVELSKLLVARKSDIKIAIVGYGDEEELVKTNLAHLEKNVHFYGKVDFLTTKMFYCNSKVYVSTSYYEGLPGTCLEAMASGLPAVVWDFNFYHGLIKSGFNGYLVRPIEIDKMANNILKILENDSLRHQMGQAAIEHVRKHYQWKSIASAVLDLLKQDPEPKYEKTIAASQK